MNPDEIKSINDDADYYFNQQKNARASLRLSLVSGLITIAFLLAVIYIMLTI